MTQVVDIKPAPDGHGFCLFFGNLPPPWFVLDVHAIGYAREVFPSATIRVFACDSVIAYTIPPRDEA